MNVDESKFLVEKSNPLLSSIHLAAPGAICFLWPGDGEAFRCGASAQDAEHLHQNRMIEAVVMLAIGLSMAGVVLGNLNNEWDFSTKNCDPSTFNQLYQGLRLTLRRSV